jgi:hypothetical protein
MAVKSVYWIFTNESDADGKIIVHDRKSANTLNEVLKAHPQVWIMKEEIADSSSTKVASTPERKTGGIVVPPPFGGQSAPAPKPPSEKRTNEERRTQKRFTVNFRIILISKNRSFRSISKDISLGGMKLKTAVPPEFSGQECVAYISDLESKENIEMTCSVIADPKDPCRVQFSDPGSDALKRLSVWLEQNAKVKKAG